MEEKYDKLNKLMKISIKIIINYLEKNITNTEKINEIKTFLVNFPVEQSSDVDAFLESKNAVGELARSRNGERILLIKSNATDNNIEDIMTTIHEYAHALSAEYSSQKIGNLEKNSIFEEAMAVAFSEACVNEWIKDNKMEPRLGIQENLTIYTNERSIINTIFLALSENNMDIKAMLEYVLGNKDYFVSICNNQIGDSFIEIFSLIENEISKHSPSGFEFRNEENKKEIEKIYDLVKDKCWDIIPSETIDNLNVKDNDFTNSKNRYVRSNKIIIEKYFKHICNKSMLERIGILPSDIEDFQKYCSMNNSQFYGIFDFYKIFDFKEDELIQKLLEGYKYYKEWSEEVNFSISELYSLGLNTSEINRSFTRFDENTGKRINRKLEVNKLIVQKFEQECNFTIEELKEMGFTDEEIEKLQVSHDLITGEKNDRRKVVEEAIDKKFKKNRKELLEQGGITLSEVGKRTTSSFSENPVRANYTFGQFEKGVNNQNIKNKPQGDEHNGES